MALIRFSSISKKLYLFSFFSLLTFSSTALACTCRDKNVGEVVYSKDIVLTKLRINSPSITERVRSYFAKPTYSKSYGITVLENYKGTFNSSSITASTIDGETDCSRRVTYGETLFLIAYKNSEGYTSNEVNACNTTSEKFSEAVKKELANPSDAYKSVDTFDWMQFKKTETQTFYADIKNVTKDEYGSYIWVLMNASGLNYKSQKFKIQISCKEKMYLASHDVFFSELNANGDVLRMSPDLLMSSNKWLPMNDLYSRLLQYTCS